MPTRLLLSARKRERSALSARRRRKERSRSSSAARARARYTSRGSRTRLRGPPRGCSSGLRGTGPNGLSSAASQDISPPEPRRGRAHSTQTPREDIPMTWALIGTSRACAVTRASLPCIFFPSYPTRPTCLTRPSRTVRGFVVRSTARGMRDRFSPHAREF